MLTLVWGIGSERPVRAILEELDRIGAPARLIEQRQVLETEVELDVASTVGGEIRVAGDAIDLAEVTACYVRPYDCMDLQDVARAGLNSPAWRHAAEVQDVLSCWTEVTPALVVNRFDAMASNGSKPYQLARIHEFGFQVPETLVTTQPDAARSFWERHGSVVYKSISGIRSRVSRLGAAHLERLGDISFCPTQFQQYIAGTDYRVHVVGNEIYSCAVQSEADDYRYPGAHDVAIDACSLPWEVEDRCRRLAASMGLHIAGVDLRCGTDGAWYCFEVNPSPGFLYYEEATGLPIGAAIARLLAGGAGAAPGATPELEASDANPP